MASDGTEDQKGKDRPHVFQTEGLEHFNYSPKVIVTIGLVSFVLTIIVGTIMGYKSALSEIDAGISNNRTLNKTLDKHEFEIQNLKEGMGDVKQEQRSIICQINKGKNCK